MHNPDRDSRVVLIAERDQNVRALQRHFLTKAGFGVEFADDGEAALDRARLTQPAVVVTEILIQKLDGLALCRRLRQDPLTREIPVVVFSVLAAAARAAEAGANLYLRKPLVGPVFIAAVQGVLAAYPTEVMEEQWAL